MHAAPLPARAPLISRRFLRSFPFNLQGAGRPPAFLIPYRSLRSLPSAPSPCPLALLCAWNRRGWPADWAPQRIFIGMIKRPAVGAAEAAPLLTTTRTSGMGQRPGRAVPITLLTWRSLMSSCRVPSLLDFGLRVSGSVSSAPLVLCWLIRYSCFVRLEHPSHT